VTPVRVVRLVDPHDCCAGVVPNYAVSTLMLTA